MLLTEANVCFFFLDYAKKDVEKFYKALSIYSTCI